MNTRNTGPIVDWVKLWTLLNTPLRVMNVPSRVSRKVVIPRTSVQSRILPRRCSTIAEWRNAVPLSQGRKLAFSTGSQAQAPPHPSTAYDHQPPSTIPNDRKVHGIIIQRR